MSKPDLDNVIYLASRRPVVPDDVTHEAYQELLAIVLEDQEMADMIIAAGWRPGGGNAA
jgi:hypothetical protein